MANLTGWETGRRVRFINFNDRTYAFNGINRPQCYNGVEWSYAGIENYASLTPPSPAFTLGSGSLTGTYRYYIAPANLNKTNVDGTIRTGIPVYWGQTAPSGQGVTINGIPASHSDPQVTHYRIFRNRNGYFDTGIPDDIQPDAFYYVADVALGTTTYADNLDDTTMSSRERIDFDRQYLPTAKYASSYANRLWTSGMHTFTGGTVTVNANTVLIDLTDDTFPDGVVGGWFTKDGEARKYRIASRSSTTQIVLEEAFVGTLSGDTYSIYRDKHILNYTKWRDCEACGPDGEENRYNVELPGKHEVTGHIPYAGRLLVFAIDRCFWLQAGEDENPDSVAMGEYPLWVGLGAVNGDSIWLADGHVYFLSMRGLCRWDGEGQPELLDGLGTDWLENLAPAELDYCGVNQDPYNGEIVIAAPGASQTENCYEYSFDPKTGGFFPDFYTHPGIFSQGRDSNGDPCLFYAQDNFIIQRSRGTTDLVPSGTVTGTVTSRSSTTATDSTATLFTTGNGLREAYIHFFHPTTHAHLGSRRISSNTGTQVTWSSSGAGGGTLTVDVGTVYVVGSVWWYWKTPVMAVPAHGQSNLACHIGVEPPNTSSRYVYVTETVDGTDKSVKRLVANKRFELVPLLQSGKTMQLKVESREAHLIANDCITIRDITIDREVREGPA